MKSIKKISITVILLFSLIPLFSQNGKISGKVVDATTNESLPFVNVVVSGTTIGTTTDLDGNFLIIGLKPGYVRLSASFIGYNTTLSPEVDVNNSNIANITISMESADTQLGEVTVKANQYRKTEESPVSLRSIGAGE